MPRLPDIPIDLYTADQQAEFERQTNSLMPALTFQLAAQEHASQIPPDITLDATPETKHLELLNQQRQSELDLEAQHKAENSTQYQKYLDLLKQQEDARNAATQEAAQNGIPTPEDWTAQIHQDANRPTSLPMDNTSSALYGAGTPESAPAAPDANGLTSSDGITPIGDTIQSGLSSFGSALGSSLSSAAENIKDSASAFGQHVGELAQGAQNLPGDIKDAASSATGTGQDIWQGTKDVANTAFSDLKDNQLNRDIGEFGSSVQKASEENQAYDDQMKAYREAKLADPNADVQPPEGRGLFPESQKTSLAAGFRLPAKALGDLVDLVQNDPNREYKMKDQYGIMDAMGITDGMTSGQIVQNLPVGPILGAMMWSSMGADLIEHPLETGAGLAFLGTLGKMVTSPWGRRAGLAILGAVGGGIDAAMNERDVPTEAAAGGLAGATLPNVVGDVAKPALSGAAKIIYDVAKAPTTRDILGYLDTLAGKVYNTATDSVAKFPGIADGLGANTTGNPAKTSLVDAAQSKLSILDRIGAMRDGTFDQFRELHTYLTQQGEQAGQRLQSITDVPQILEEERQKAMSILKSPAPETTATGVMAPAMAGVADTLTSSAAATAEELGGRKPWTVFNPTSGKDLRYFDTEEEASRYVDQFKSEGWDYGPTQPAAPIDPNNPMQIEAPLTQQDLQNQAADTFASRAKFTEPERAGSVVRNGALAGPLVGATTGAAAGYLSADDNATTSEKLDRASKGWLAGALLGVPLGPAAGLASATGLAKLFEAGIRNGMIGTDLWSTHPDAPFRVATALLLAARGKADSELVDIPARVTGFQRNYPTQEFPFEPMTAGAIREKYGNLDANLLGRTARDMLSDYFTGGDTGARRAREIGADLSAGTGRFDQQPQEISRDVQHMNTQELSQSTHTSLTQSIPGWGDLWDMVDNIAQRNGVAPPRVFIEDNPRINAHAYLGTTGVPVITINRGSLDRLTTPELESQILHELAHATDADTGWGLKQQFSDIKDRALEWMKTGQVSPTSTDHLAAPGELDNLPAVPPPGRITGVTPETSPTTTQLPASSTSPLDVSPHTPGEVSTGLGAAGQHLAAGAVGAGVGAADSSQEDPDNNGLTFGKIAGGALIGGVLWGGRKKALPDFITNDSKYAMFGKPKPDGRLITAGPIESAYNWWTSHATDSLERLQGYQDDIAKEFRRQTGMALPASMLAAELKRFDADGRARIFIDQSLKPAIVTFRNLGIDDQMVDSYLSHTQDLDIAKHQGNYSNTGQYANRVFPSGNFAVDSEKYLAKTDAWIRNQNTVPNPATGIIENSGFTPEQQKQFYGAMKQVWDTGDKILQWKRDAGLITDDTYNQLRQVFPHYVPTNIVAYIGDAGNVAVGKSLSVTSNTIKSLSHQGTEKTALGPLASLVSATYEASRAAQKNQVFNAFVNMWQEASRLAPNTLQEGSSALGNSRPSGRVRDFADLVQLMPTTHPVSAGDKAWQPLEGFIDGVKLRFAVHKDLGAVTKFDAPSNIPILSGMMAAFRAGATSRNPVFLASNLALDAANYMIRETARSGNPWTPAKNYAETLATILLNPRVWMDMGKNELRGDEARLLAEGGGSAGHTPAGNYIPNQQFNPDPTQAGWLESTVGQIVEKLHGSPMSESQREVERLGRDVGYRTGAGTLAGAVAGGYAGNLATPDNATPAERVEKVFGGGAAGALAGGHLVGRIEARSVADVNRILGDLFTLKPVERIGEHIEAIPRVAAMKNAEERYQGPISDLIGQHGAKVTEQLGYHPSSPQYQQAGMEASRLQSQVDDTIERQRIEAVQSARTTTIDFNKGGTWAKAINQVVPFFNVNMQSAADMPRMLKENPVAATTVMASLILPSVAAEYVNNRNKETRKDYDDVPQYVKDQGLVIMLPNETDGAKVPVDENGNRHPQYITIRYRQFAPIAVASRELLQASPLFKDATSTVARSAVDSLFSMAQGISPVPSNSAGDFLTNLTSPLVGTATQLAFNKDTFRNRDIMTKGADEHASPLSQELARRLGGNSDTMGRPSWWEFASRDLLTGRAGMWHGLSDIVAGKPKGGDPQIADTPVVGSLASRWVKGSIGEEANVARVSLLTPSGHQILKDNNIEWRPTPSNPAIGDVDLTQREYADYQRTLNQVTDKAIHDMPNDPRWNTWSRLEKENAVKNAVDQDKAHATSVWYQANITPEQRKQRIQHAIDMEKITPNRPVRR